MVDNTDKIFAQEIVHNSSQPKAWCKFLCISGEAKLLSATGHTIFTGCHSMVLWLVAHKRINKCFTLQGNLMISLEDMHS